MSRNRVVVLRSPEETGFHTDEKGQELQEMTGGLEVCVCLGKQVLRDKWAGVIRRRGGATQSYRAFFFSERTETMYRNISVRRMGAWDSLKNICIYILKKRDGSDGREVAGPECRFLGALLMARMPVLITGLVLMSCDSLSVPH